MSTIRTNLTEKQFDQYVRLYISVAKRGFESKVALYKVIYYILKKLYTGCQWKKVPIGPDTDYPEKKKSVGMPFITVIASGAEMVV